MSNVHASMEPRGHSANLEVRHLRLIAAVAETRSVTAAAALLHVTQSAASHQLIGLERMLGARLFDRVGRRLQITASGRRLLDLATRVLPELDRAAAALCDPARAPAAPLRVTTSCYTSYRWLPQALTRFSISHPRVQIEVELAATRRAVAALVADEVDLAITTEPVPGAAFASAALFADDLVALVPAGHRWAKQRALPWQALRGERVLTHEACAADHDRLRRAIERGGGHAELRALPLTEAIAELVKAGFGIAVLGSWSVVDHVRRGEVAAVPLRPRARRGFRAVWRRANPRGLPLRELAALIRDTCSPAS